MGVWGDGIFEGDGACDFLGEVMEQLALASPTQEDRLGESLKQTLLDMPHGTSTVIVSTRAADLQDTERFAEVWDDPSLRNALREVHVIDVSAGEFQDYFETV